MADEQGAKPDPAAALNKAQAEFEKYTKRVQAQQGGAVPVFMMPYPQGGNMGPGWAVPPSVAMLPRAPGGGGAAAAGSLTDSLGTSVRLSVDAINAALVGGVRLLSGIAGLAGGYDHAGEGCGCESCCEQECCGQDCCGCECCRPGVGSCC